MLAYTEILLKGTRFMALYITGGPDFSKQDNNLTTSVNLTQEVVAFRYGTMNIGIQAMKGRPRAPPKQDLHFW